MKKSISFFCLSLFCCCIISCHTNKKFYTTSVPSTSSSSKNKLQEEIKNWLGVPYKFGGNTKQGIDCSGFVNVIYANVYQKKLPRTTKEIYSISKPIIKENLQEGDLVFFDIEGKGISHVGIFLDNNNFVHSSSSKGVTISSLSSTYYKNHFVKGGRIIH